MLCIKRLTLGPPTAKAFETRFFREPWQMAMQNLTIDQSRNGMIQVGWCPNLLGIKTCRWPTPDQLKQQTWQLCLKKMGWSSQKTRIYNCPSPTTSKIESLGWLGSPFDFMAVMRFNNSWDWKEHPKKWSKWFSAVEKELFVSQPSVGRYNGRIFDGFVCPTSFILRLHKMHKQLLYYWNKFRTNPDFVFTYSHHPGKGIIACALGNKTPQKYWVDHLVSENPWCWEIPKILWVDHSWTLLKTGTFVMTFVGVPCCFIPGKQKTVRTNFSGQLNSEVSYDLGAWKTGADDWFSETLMGFVWTIDYRVQKSISQKCFFLYIVDFVTDVQQIESISVVESMGFSQCAFHPKNRIVMSTYHMIFTISIYVYILYIYISPTIVVTRTSFTHSLNYIRTPTRRKKDAGLQHRCQGDAQEDEKTWFWKTHSPFFDPFLIETSDQFVKNTACFDHCEIEKSEKKLVFCRMVAQKQELLSVGKTPAYEGRRARPTCQYVPVRWWRGFIVPMDHPFR